MISGRICRIFVSDGKRKVPEGYTSATSLRNLCGLKSLNIHIHLGPGWDLEDGDFSEDFLQRTIVNLSCNPKPPVITMGQFDPRINRMLIAMEVLGL